LDARHIRACFGVLDVRRLTKAGCKKVFREVASGAKTDRAQLRRLLDQLEVRDVVTVTRLDPPATC
jgi:DNA invertase Pin-like site-specific DNA recombinase